MKIYAITSSSVDWLCHSIFLPSVKQCEPEANVSVVEANTEGNGDFRSPGFKAAQHLRLEKILEWVQGNTSHRILISDVDIKYLRPFVKRMNEECGDADLAFQRETRKSKGGANLGQMLIRCSPATLHFFESVLAEYRRTGEWEQSILNRRLRSAGLSYRLLSPLFSNSNLGFQRDMYSFHTTCTEPRVGATSVDLKQRQFAALNKYLGHPEGSLNRLIFAARFRLNINWNKLFLRRLSTDVNHA